MFALDDRITGETVGFCGLVHPGDQAEVEVKYAFLKDCWGKGYASEMLPALLTYAAKALGIGEIMATVAEGNIASQRVLQKSGLRFTRTLEEDPWNVQVYTWRADG